MSYNKSRCSDSSFDSVLIKTPIEEDVRSIDEKRHWKVIDTITYEDGRVETREYYNTVVDDCSKLIACLMKGASGQKGIAYWAVGKGSISWDNNNPPSPLITETKLISETFRKAVTAQDIVFTDAQGNVTQSITNRLRVSVTFLEGEANGELREFGLFGGTATATKDSGTMINKKHHGLITKSEGMRLDRQVHIVF